MIHVGQEYAHLCDGISRRDFLRLGGVSLLGLSLADVLRAQDKSKREMSCILFYLQGGQSQLDVWDMKPDAPAGIRSEFQPIKTNVPGIEVCEHIPRLAKMADRYAIIRSMTHDATNHNPGGYVALTGGKPKRDTNNLPPSPDDLPHPGCVITALKPSQRPVPTFVSLSAPFVGDAGAVMPGQTAGFMGAKYDPLKVTADPNLPHFSVEELSLPDTVSVERLEKRRSFVQRIDKQLGKLSESPEMTRMDAFYQRAFALLTSSETRNAFNIAKEPDKLRDGQRLLLARRLIESGVRLVTVYWGGALNAPLDYWDTHQKNFPKQKDRLLPEFDQCFSALLEDLEQRGLLETTFVIAMGEFGRTPKIGQITANAGTDATGRDHWPWCYSIVVAGGGVRGGLVIGKSDEITYRPTERPVTPDDFRATLFHVMGLNAHADVHDQLGRPIPISRGEPVMELF
jgi:hypothetical protein